MKLLFALFVVIPLVEIYLLIKIGSIVGAGTTIFLVVFTALLGAFLVRSQGISTLIRAQAQLAKAQLPAVEMLEGLCLFIAGALLLTPGFFTDTIGFALLIPRLRRGIIRRLIGRGFAGSAQPQRPHRQGDERIIEAEYKEID